MENKVEWIEGEVELFVGLSDVREAAKIAIEAYKESKQNIKYKEDGRDYEKVGPDKEVRDLMIKMLEALVIAHTYGHSVNSGIKNFNK